MSEFMDWLGSEPGQLAGVTVAVVVLAIVSVLTRVGGGPR